MIKMIKKAKTQRMSRRGGRNEGLKNSRKES